MRKFLLSIFAVLFAFAGVQAQETVVYTLQPAAGSNNSYTSNCDVTIDDITWNVEGNSQMQPWRLGGKSITNVDRAVYSKTAMPNAVDKIVLELGTMSSITVNSAKLLIADNVDFANATTVPFTATASSLIEIPVSAASGAYYKFVFNVTVSSTSNKFVQFAKAVFYGTSAGGGETTEPEEEKGFSWNLVEDVNDIEAGDEVIIVAEGASVALGAMNDSYHTSKTVTLSENTLTDTGDAIVLIVGENSGYYTFSYDNKYLNYEGSKNTLTTTDAVAESSSWGIEIVDGVATISNVGNSERKLQYNSSSPRFACYKGTQKNVRLYKKNELLSHTLTVSDAGWATLYLATTARIPSTVEAYTVTKVNDGWVSLTQVTGVIPTETGIIVKADAGDYKFFLGETATADVAGNFLEGTLYNKNIDVEAYVLGVFEGEVGLYKAEMTDGSWLNNANKAYLPVSAVPNASATFYGFDWNGTTGIDEMTEQRAESKEIYDLTGRRVEEITAPGIYIVGGKKVLVK